MSLYLEEEVVRHNLWRVPRMAQIYWLVGPCLSILFPGETIVLDVVNCFKDHNREDSKEDLDLGCLETKNQINKIEVDSLKQIK